MRSEATGSSASSSAITTSSAWPGKLVHTIARSTGNSGDRIEGVCFAMTEEELAATDSYKVDVYGRTEVELESGVRALVYFDPPLAETQTSAQDHS